MLVYAQNPEVTFFGGKTFWKKKFNRTINKDARPYVILAPMGPVMLVYDVMETEGRDEPEDFLNKGLGHNPNMVEGHIDPKLYDNAIEETRKWGISVVFKPLNHFKGWHIRFSIIDQSIEICLKEGASREENFSVLMHELAHLFMGHTHLSNITYKGKEKPFKLLQRKIPRPTEELEAETVSYLICYKLGLITRSAEYIAGYYVNEDVFEKFSYENVIKISDKIEKMFVKKK